MKKIVSALFAFALLFAFVACTPEDNNGENGEGQNDPEKLATTGEASDVTDCSATLTGYTNFPYEPRDAEVGIMYDKSQSFDGAKKIAAAGLDANNKFTVTATDLEPSTTYYFKAYFQEGTVEKYGAVKSFTTKELKIPDTVVDLGIAMTREDGTTYELYWAQSNLSTGALCAHPEDYGEYYAWGETGPKSNYGWSSYKFGKTSSGPYSKYNTRKIFGTVDNKTVLEAEDDVAHVKLGGRWRMPTDPEWTELRAKCTWAWTTQNGVNGFLVTASNGKSIFLPAAGYRREANLNDAGSIGAYWSSSLDKDSPYYAWFTRFHYAGVDNASYFRSDGFCIRPVFEK